MKGLGSELVSARKRLMAACKSATDRKTPRLNRRLVSLAKKPSTALSQDAEVGVKWNVQRGCRQAIGAPLDACGHITFELYQLDILPTYKRTGKSMAWRRSRNTARSSSIGMWK